MSDTKTKGVMDALKNRSGFGSKKGVALLGIVKKLTAKRKAEGKDTMAHEGKEPLMKKMMEKKMGTD